MQAVALLGARRHHGRDREIALMSRSGREPEVGRLVGVDFAQALLTHEDRDHLPSVIEVVSLRAKAEEGSVGIAAELQPQPVVRGGGEHETQQRTVQAECQLSALGLPAAQRKLDALLVAADEAQPVDVRQRFGLSLFDQERTELHLVGGAPPTRGEGRARRAQDQARSVFDLNPSFGFERGDAKRTQRMAALVAAAGQETQEEHRGADCEKVAHVRWLSEAERAGECELRWLEGLVPRPKSSDHVRACPFRRWPTRGLRPPFRAPRSLGATQLPS